MADPKDTGSTYAVGWLIMTIILVFLGWVIWYYNKYEIMDTIRWVRWAELQVLDPFYRDDAVIAVFQGKPITFGALERQIETTPALNLTPGFLYIVSRIVMTPYLIFFSLLMVLCGLWAMFYGPGTQLRTKYDLNGLIKMQAKSFPIIAPLADFDPAKQPVRPPGAPVPAELPPFAEALAPEEWIAYCEIPTGTDRNIDPDAAARAFSKQLGGPWRGWMHMKPHRQILMAAFCLKAVRKRKESDDILGRLAMCWRGGRFALDGALLREARSVLRNRNLSGVTISKCNQHAFENTAMIRALASAREEGGVLAPAQFVWLRAYDRVLWYPLNNLGRQAYHMEALGAMSHYKAERLIQRPVVRPKVEGAVETLAEYMKSHRARPIPELNYSGSRRRGIKKVKGTALS